MDTTRHESHSSMDPTLDDNELALLRSIEARRAGNKIDWLKLGNNMLAAGVDFSNVPDVEHHLKQAGATDLDKAKIRLVSNIYTSGHTLPDQALRAISASIKDSALKEALPKTGKYQGEAVIYEPKDSEITEVPPNHLN